ncbi:MAG: HAMP domain-containing histidine kinase [Lachnospiraceae bacterium]|nr:HAMP domain-containing histidine kinase [Lachnospiraceae bacterium]
MARFFSLKSKKQADAEREELLQIEKREQEERRKLEEKELEVKKLSEDVVWFKRLMAHNIRMPLAIIVGYGELLTSMNFSSREEELDCIKKICTNIDYLDTLSKVLLDNEQEDLLLEKKYFDILECVRQTAEYVSVIAQKAGIKISVISSKNEVLFYGNRIALMRAFFNLIENSIRYMNRQGNIYFTVEETENEILVVYRDDGEGMQADEAQHITELNFQGSNKKAGGHGIGMYLIKETVEKQGGTLNVKTGNGNGMGVYMSFPKR